jgi:hypothetical protein
LLIAVLKVCWTPLISLFVYFSLEKETSTPPYWAISVASVSYFQYPSIPVINFSLLGREGINGLKFSKDHSSNNFQNLIINNI